MMAFRFSRSFRLWLLASLKTSFECLYCVPLFLKLFASASLGFFFLEICPIIAQDYFWWFLTSRLGGRPFRFISGIGATFLLLCLFGFEVLRSVRACLVRVLHYFFEFLSPCLALHNSIGSGRSSVLRIESNSTIVWPWWFTRMPQGSLLPPWVRGRETLVKSDILAALNI